MPENTLPDVLDQIISLTSERDSDALASSLGQVLSTLTNVSNTTLYSVGNINRAKHAIANQQTQPESEVISADLIDALLDCLLAINTTATTQAGKHLTLFPLIGSNKQPLGVIALEETNDADDHALTMQVLAIYHHFMSLMHDNERDTLTGLLNRKTFDHKVSDIITDLQSHAREHADEKPSYLAIFDIDHFKQVNDAHGHLIGDEVLLLFSQQLSKNFREKDMLFRFGGEEFVGVFQCLNDDTIRLVLNRLRETIAQFNFPQVGHITVSCGFTKIGAFDLSSNIIDRADVSLYHAKHTGRNQVCQHEQLIASGALTTKEDSSGEIELF